jgi:hypothetical protein
MTHTRQTTRRQIGVTLVEMMVALAITTFVLLVVNQLFNQVISTVRRGTQAGEILQRSRAFDEQIAIETELIISGGRDPANNPYDWFGRMVGPKGREAGQPGGFLVIVQRVLDVPLTLDDAVKQVTRPVRSDQLMFIYDQTPLFDQTGKKRLPPLAPSSNGSFSGDMVDSMNSDYVKIWYGHVTQLNDLGTMSGTLGQIGVQDNPNVIAQDWALGRQALFLRTGPVPVGKIYAQGAGAFDNVVNAPPLMNALYTGITDISVMTLNDLTGPVGLLTAAISNDDYQDRVLGKNITPGIRGGLAYSNVPLLTLPKPIGTNLQSKDIARNHTYFMGGVSDFIVEWAGDVVTGNTTYATPTATPNPDGELDRDPEGRIKWYTNQLFSNRDLGNNRSAVNPDAPVTYPVPLGGPGYMPFNNGNNLAFADAAFVWQNDGTPDFTQWPWLIRIRYRLHDRHGDFDGRQVTVDPATGETEPEAGAWFETIIPVNHQGVK